MDEPRAAWRTFGTPDATTPGDEDAGRPPGPVVGGPWAGTSAGRTRGTDGHGLPAARQAVAGPGEPGSGTVLDAAPRLLPLLLAAATGAVLAAAVVLVVASPGASAVVVDATASGPPGAVATGGPGTGGAAGTATGGSGTAGTAGAAASGAAAATEVLVDVEGAVARPGIVRLADGSRVGDAIAAAGGYAPSVDVPRAAALLNLAARVADGDRVRVPVVGEPATDATGLAAPTADATAGGATGGAIPAGGGSAGGSAGRAAGAGGLVDVNRASATELDALPGIGPVTAQKIIDARAAAPFASIADLRDRKVVSAATFAKIEALVTVGP